MITLRPYQVDGENKIRQAFAKGFKAPLYVLPTGGGKSILFASIAHSADRRGKRVLILAHRIELIDQIVDTLKKFDVHPEIIAAGYHRSTRLTNRSIAVASVQTLVRRMDQYAPPTLIVADEAHHCAAGNTWSTILRHYADAKIMGVTATPLRLDSKGLAAHFDHLIVGPSPRELTEQGYLARARIFAPPTVDTSGLHIRAGEFKSEETEALMDTPAIIGDALAHYRKHADGKRALVFCTSVAHAHHVAERFRNDGISALALDGDTDKVIRRMAVQDFRDGKIQVITNCQLFTEGLDIIGVEVGMLLRPTASLGLYLQMCGRILRTAPGKESAIIFDHANNASVHGLPQDDREWTLTSDIVHKKKAKPSVRVCPKCWAASPSRARTCVECGHVFEVQARQDVEEREGELVELTAEQIAKRRERQAQGMTKELADLIALGKRKGYAEGWAIHIYQARQAKKHKLEQKRNDANAGTVQRSDTLPL